MSKFEPCTTPAAKRRHWRQAVQSDGSGGRYGRTLCGNRAMPTFFGNLLPCKSCDKAKAARERAS
jgi:hypothetical protein